ncbi:MAG TPA: hypothetical protein V6D03_12650, partial [Candidatus Caenarcaniphilales bacterium]
MDDSAVIQAFVGHVMQGEAILLSNPNLRTESIFRTSQLLSKKEGLIATAKLTQKPRSILAKKSSAYWQLIHQAMLAKSLFPVEDLQSGGFCTYQHRTIPEGYQINCTEAMKLWRAWWGSSSRNQRLGIPLEFLLLIKGSAQRQGTWYPIRAIICSNGTLYIKTLGGEVAAHGLEMVVWLHKPLELNRVDSPASTVTPPVRPGLKGY